MATSTETVARGVDDVRRVRTYLVAAAGVAAPVLFTTGQALLPALPNELAAAFPLMAEHREQLLAARLLTGLGALLFLPALVALWRLASPYRRGRWLLLGAGLLMGVGTAANALGQATYGYLAHAATAPSVPRETGAAMLAAVEGLGAEALPITFLSVPLFALGMLLIAVALLVGGEVPWWLPAGLLVSALGFAAVGGGPLGLLPGVPFTVVLAVLAVRGTLRPTALDVRAAAPSPSSV